MPSSVDDPGRRLSEPLHTNVDGLKRALRLPFNTFGLFYSLNNLPEKPPRATVTKGLISLGMDAATMRATDFRGMMSRVCRGLSVMPLWLLALPVAAGNVSGEAVSPLPILVWLALPLIVGVGSIALVVAVYALARLRGPTPPPPCKLDNWPNTSRWA